MSFRAVTNRRVRNRAGFTLFELIASLSAASVLMVGLSSALYIAVQAVDVSNSPHLTMLEAQSLLTDIQNDLQYATAFTVQDDDSIAFSIPDRDDADTLPDTVQYTWAGKDKELTRQYNGGSEVIVADEVHDLNFEYYDPDGFVERVVIELELIDDPSTFVASSIVMLNRP